jgi:hypothetical protein
MFSDNRASMTDETGSRGAIHNCHNDVYNVVGDELPVCSFTQTNPSYPFGEAKTRLGGSLLPYNLDQTYANHVGMSDGSSVALARLPKTSKEVLSGLNSLYELKDCKTLLELIPIHFLWAAARRKRTESVRELHKWLDHIRDTVRSPLGIMQAVAGVDLMWKFGIKPLVSDINAVHSQLASLNAKTRELLSKDFAVAGVFTDKAVDGGIVSSISNDTLGFYSTIITQNKTTTKTWIYGALKRIDQSKLPSINVLKFKTLVESLGLTLDATDLWEAVPYSFVVDWLFPIQTFLEQFRGSPWDPSWLQTVGCWSSVKTITTGILTEEIQPITGSNCVVSGLSGNIRFRPFTHREYVRTRLDTLPTTIPITYIPRPQWPTWDQSVTGIELILQRIKRSLK